MSAPRRGATPTATRPSRYNRPKRVGRSRVRGKGLAHLHRIYIQKPKCGLIADLRRSHGGLNVEGTTQATKLGTPEERGQGSLAPEPHPGPKRDARGRPA